MDGSKNAKEPNEKKVFFNISKDQSSKVFLLPSMNHFRFMEIQYIC